ncbi:hypothetical protein IFM46972_11314 [Aspergillus udagawae]|uniref:BZIP domain-containing protein n=1 Tax=Aspergillus udagawae TaxID=91492 RepID=A0A8H3XS15_9EURO|nr:hypothetical protein IFM46972_11314 [Aspergillus udagawae]
MDTPPCDGQSDRQNTPEPFPPVNHSKLLKRGRPRIERAGETAGERRKEQIRLAQRAYRFRKDLRIAALDQKVVELEQTILAIRDLYLSVHTSVVDSGIAVSHPFLVQSMQTNLQLLRCLTQSVSSRGAEYQPSSTYHSTEGSWDDQVLGRKPPLPSPPLSGHYPTSRFEPLRLPFDSPCTSPGEAPDVLPDQSSLNPLLVCDEYFWEQPSNDMNNDEISLAI